MFGILRCASKLLKPFVAVQVRTYKIHHTSFQVAGPQLDLCFNPLLPDPEIGFLFACALVAESLRTHSGVCVRASTDGFASCVCSLASIIEIVMTSV